MNPLVESIFGDKESISNASRKAAKEIEWKGFDEAVSEFNRKPDNSKMPFRWSSKTGQIIFFKTKFGWNNAMLSMMYSVAQGTKKYINIVVQDTVSLDYYFECLIELTGATPYNDKWKKCVSYILDKLQTHTEIFDDKYNNTMITWREFKKLLSK